jgi:hypothetical protein
MNSSFRFLSSFFSFLPFSETTVSVWAAVIESDLTTWAVSTYARATFEIKKSTAKKMSALPVLMDNLVFIFLV